MESPPTLADTQRLFWKLMTVPEGVATALSAPGDGAARLRAAVEAQIIDHVGLTAVERLDLYANMYFYRLHDCLAEDFRAVATVVGPEQFHNLITDYLLVHPSTHPSLRFAGRHLPQMLATHMLSARWPFVADLARLEWAILDAFDAPDARAVRHGELEAIPPSDWPAICLRLHPSVQLLDLAWAVQDVWAQVDRGKPIERPAETPTALAVWRSDFRVFHRPMSAWERAAVVCVRDGGTFGAVCESVAQMLPADDAVSTVLGGLRRWVSDGLLAPIRSIPIAP